MALFQSRRNDDVAEPEDIILLWKYELSEDGGETWHPEVDPAARKQDVLRRGTWVSPPVN